MTGSKSHLRSGLSDLDYSYRGRGLRLDDQGNIIAELLVVPSPLKPVSASRFTWRQLLSCSVLLRVTLFVIGAVYGLTSLSGEYHYALGQTRRERGHFRHQRRSP